MATPPSHVWHSSKRQAGRGAGAVVSSDLPSLAMQNGDLPFRLALRLSGRFSRRVTPPLRRVGGVGKQGGNSGLIGCEQTLEMLQMAVRWLMPSKTVKDVPRIPARWERRGGRASWGRNHLTVDLLSQRDRAEQGPS